MALYSSDGVLLQEARPTALSANAPQHLLDKFNSKSPRQKIEVPSRLKVVEEPVMFGGFLMNHYGHFLVDSMARLWARNLYPGLPIVFTTPWPRRDQPTFSRELFAALGLSSRVFSVEEPTLFQRIICPGTAIENRWKIFSAADEPHLEAARMIDGGRVWRRPVYLTRSGLPKQAKAVGEILRHMRKAEEEPELEAEMIRRGVEVVAPESLPLADQISMFRTAPLVIGMTGSAFHTSLFSRSSDLRLAIFNWGKGSENQMLIDTLKQHTAYYSKSMQFRKEEGDHRLDVGLSLRLLGEAGLLVSRTYSASATSG